MLAFFSNCRSHWLRSHQLEYWILTSLNLTGTADTQEVPPWLDAELQADIEAATGHDLGSKRSQAKDNKAKGAKGKGKGKGKGKKKYEGLTDIRETKNTTRARLENKVFNK